ncbi:MAG TPA: MFS transporter [Tepidisphaeraceae bacterium]|nr:MFS transporter [Tepidisphaeraceae bacterium]
MMRLERLRYSILGLLFLSTVINYVDRQALAVLVPTLREDLGLSSASYGTIATLFMAAYTIAQAGGGLLIDRLGTRLGFVIFIAAWSAAAAGHALATGVAVLAALRFLLGLGEAGNWPAGGKAISEWFPKHRRAFAMGVFDGGSAIGAIVAQPLVAAIAIFWGWRAAFLITGLLGFVWLIAWLAIYRRPDEHPWLSEADRAQVLEETGALASPVKKHGYLEAIKPLLRVRQLWGLMGTRMLATPVWWFYVFWLPDYLSKERGFTLKEIGMFGWIPFLTVDIGKLVGGAASDRLLARGRSATFARKVVMTGGAICMLAGVQVAGAPNAAFALAWISVATFGFGMWSANILALHADIFPSSSMATVVGLTGTAASFGGAVSTYLIGRLVDSAGYGPVFWMAAFATAAAFLCLMFGLGRVSMIQPRPAEAHA